jgi:hypothetical protein
MQPNLVEIETDVVLTLVLLTGGSVPRALNLFIAGYPIRLSGLSRHSHQTKKELRTLGWCPRLLAPLRCGIDRGNEPHTFILAEAAHLAVMFRPSKREKCGPGERAQSRARVRGDGESIGRRISLRWPAQDRHQGRPGAGGVFSRPLGLGYWEGLKLSDAERAVLAEIGHRLGRRLLAEVANVARPDAWPLAARAQQPNAAERIWRDFLR